MQSYYRYWGKTEKVGKRYHLLPYHCLDVAAVGWLLLDPSKPLCKQLAIQFEVSPEIFQRWVTFFLCLHDIGKFATAFQSLVTGLSVELVPANKRMPYIVRHDSLGYLFWDDDDGLYFKLLETETLAEEGADVSTLHLRRTYCAWLQIVAGHHGIPPKTDQIYLANHFTKDDENAALQFVQSICTMLPMAGDAAIFANKSFLQRLQRASWVLAGIVVLADWLGSGRSPETYQQTAIPLNDYWRSYAVPFAEQTVASAQIESSPVAEYAGVSHLFPFIKTLTPLQQWASERKLSDRNQLIILEDVTGAGKTEAALTLAHRLLANGLADGLYVALPTMATANSMYERLKAAYRRIYASDALPSLALAHGARHLSAGFRDSFIQPENTAARLSYDHDDETAEAFCSAWLADSRKKSLLADVGVGTIDQALLAVLPAKHQSLRCFGLNRKVLLVDEVHSYDPYMNHLLQCLLTYHAAMGGSTILLSATLPFALRQKYVTAFADGAELNAPELKERKAYPLATHFPTSEQPETVLATRREVERIVSVVLLDGETKAFDIIRAAVVQGQCVCWVRNTVGDAIKAYRLLAQQSWMDKDRLSLFHSRFAMFDRQRIEAATLKNFGKESTAEIRRGRVLVATQVVEQSLDLDFDVMISDLAPVDLLIQRAGREHRHVRDADGNWLNREGAVDLRPAPTLYIVGPAETSDPAENWLKAVLPGTQAVYQHVGQLWLTQQLFAESKKLALPGDARTLIEGVYGDEAQAAIPAPLEELTWKAIGEDHGKLSMANLNVLNLSKGYSRSSSGSGGWNDDEKIPTRLGDDSVRIVLVVADGEAWRPYAAVDQFAWDMSMLSVPEWQWQKARQQIPSELEVPLAALKEEHKALKWVELFPLTTELAAWYGEQLGWGLYKEGNNESN